MASNPGRQTYKPSCLLNASRTGIIAGTGESFGSSSVKITNWVYCYMLYPVSKSFLFCVLLLLGILLEGKQCLIMISKLVGYENDVICAFFFSEYNKLNLNNERNYGLDKVQAIKSCKPFQLTYIKLLLSQIAL